MSVLCLCILNRPSMEKWMSKQPYIWLQYWKWYNRIAWKLSCFWGSGLHCLKLNWFFCYVVDVLCRNCGRINLFYSITPFVVQTYDNIMPIVVRLVTGSRLRIWRDRSTTFPRLAWSITSAASKKIWTKAFLTFSRLDFYYTKYFFRAMIGFLNYSTDMSAVTQTELNEAILNACFQKVSQAASFKSLLMNVADNPGWNCLSFLQVFVVYQAILSWFYWVSMHQNSLIQLDFIKLPKRCILNLATIDIHDKKTASSISKSSWDLFSWTAFLMQINFGHVKNSN